MYVAEALTPLLRLGTISWIVTRDSHTKFINSQPWSRPTGQRSMAHQWAAAHRLRTADLEQRHSLCLAQQFLLVYPLVYLGVVVYRSMKANRRVIMFSK